MRLQLEALGQQGLHHLFATRLCLSGAELLHCGDVRIGHLCLHVEPLVPGPLRASGYLIRGAQAIRALDEEWDGDKACVDTIRTVSDPHPIHGPPASGRTGLGLMAATSKVGDGAAGVVCAGIPWLARAIHMAARVIRRQDFLSMEDW